MGTLKVYDGASWITCLGKVYDGAAFTGGRMWFYDGATFVELHPTGQANPGHTVTVSGEIISEEVNGIKIGIRFNSDGTIDKLEDSTYTQIDTVTDWLAAADRGSAPGLYEVMTDNWVDTGGAGDGFDDSAAAEGVWIALTSNRLWSVEAAGTGGSSSNGMQFDAHIRWNGGLTEDTGAYDILSAAEP